MRINRFLFSYLLLLSFGVSGPSFASSTSQAEVSKAHAQLKAMAKKNNNWKRLGLDNPNAADESEVGIPVAVSMVRLDELSKFVPGSTRPESLIHSTNELIYPLKHRGNDAAVFYLENERGNWKTVGFGSPQFTHRVGIVRKQLMNRLNLSEESFTLVKIPAMNLVFIAVKGQEGVELTPIEHDNVYGFKQGKSMNSNEVFKILQPFAAKHEGLPG